jgi:thioredoxin-like negative regulator of GroEL
LKKAELQDLLGHFVTVVVDVDKDKAISDKYEVTALPFVVAQNVDGEMLGNFTGYQPAPMVSKMLSGWVAKAGGATKVKVESSKKQPAAEGRFQGGQVVMAPPDRAGEQSEMNEIHKELEEIRKLLKQIA